MRLQLALNVTNLDDAVDFYSKMFDTPPAKTKPGYANFVVADPPLKLVLFELDGAGTGTDTDTEFPHLNHLGVETETAVEVNDADARLSAAGLETTGVDEAVCCFAEKTETWLTSPEGARWEWYVKNADADQLEHASVGPQTCCS